MVKAKIHSLLLLCFPRSVFKTFVKNSNTGDFVIFILSHAVNTPTTEPDGKCFICQVKIPRLLWNTFDFIYSIYENLFLQVASTVYESRGEYGRLFRQWFLWESSAQVMELAGKPKLFICCKGIYDAHWITSTIKNFLLLQCLKIYLVMMVPWVATAAASPNIWGTFFSFWISSFLVDCGSCILFICRCVNIITHHLNATNVSSGKFHSVFRLVRLTF